MQYLSSVARWAAAAGEFCADSIAAGKKPPASTRLMEVRARARITVASSLARRTDHMTAQVTPNVASLQRNSGRKWRWRRLDSRRGERPYPLDSPRLRLTQSNAPGWRGRPASRASCVGRPDSRRALRPFVRDPLQIAAPTEGL